MAPAVSLIDQLGCALCDERTEFIRHPDVRNRSRSELQQVGVTSSDRLLTRRRSERRSAIHARFHSRRQVVSDHEIELATVLVPKPVSVLLVIAEIEADLQERRAGLRQARTVRNIVNEHIHVIGRAAHDDTSASGVSSDHEATDKRPFLGDALLGKLDDGAPGRDEIVIRHIDRQCAASHRCLISSSARSPALRSRVSVLAARSAATTAAGMVSAV